jgi:hypothetical protein
LWFGHWFSGPFMRGMQHIPVDRSAGTAAFETAVRSLKDGQVIGVFPEATISSSFTVKQLKAGAARMAVDAGVPILPAAVWGGQRIATKGHKVVLRRDVAVTVLIGEPLVPEPGEKVQALLRRTKAAMEELLVEAHRAHPGTRGRAGRRARRRAQGRRPEDRSAGPAPQPAAPPLSSPGPPARRRPHTAGDSSRKHSSSVPYQCDVRPSGCMPSRRHTARDGSLPGRTTA